MRFPEIPGDSLLGIPICFPPLGFTLLICSCGTTYFPVRYLLYFSFLGELHQSPKDNIAYVPLDPVTNCVYTSDLNNRLRVGWKTLPYFIFKLKFQTQISNSNFKLKLGFQKLKSSPSSQVIQDSGTLTPRVKLMKLYFHIADQSI